MLVMTDAVEEMRSTTGNTTFIKTCYILNSGDELIVTFPSIKNFYVHIFAMIVSTILYFPGVFLNFVVFTAIWRSRLLKEKVSNFNVMVKSVVDLAIGMLFIPLLITVLASEITGNPSCTSFMISKKLGMLGLIYSVTVMSMMNCERYLAILHPITHRVRVTRRRMLTCTLTTCCFITVLFGFTLIYVDIIPFIVNGVTLVFLSSTVFVYSSILFFCLKNRRVNPTNQRSMQSHSAVKERRQHFHQDLKVAKTCFVIIVASLACYLPGMISNISRLKLNATFSAVVTRRWFAILYLSNTTTNPAIIFWRNKAIRREGINLVKSVYSR
jgi:hypothetical protein